MNLFLTHEEKRNGAGVADGDSMNGKLFGATLGQPLLTAADRAERNAMFKVAALLRARE